jgi:hypothetical protein
VSKLGAILQEHVVRPLNEAGIPIDLRGVQAGLLLLPIAIVVVAFIHASWRKRQQLKDLE